MVRDYRLPKRGLDPESDGDLYPAHVVQPDCDFEASMTLSLPLTGLLIG